MRSLLHYFKQVTPRLWRFNC